MSFQGDCVYAQGRSLGEVTLEAEHHGKNKTSNTEAQHNRYTNKRANHKLRGLEISIQSCCNMLSKVSSFQQKIEIRKQTGKCEPQTGKRAEIRNLHWGA